MHAVTEGVSATSEGSASQEGGDRRPATGDEPTPRDVRNPGNPKPRETAGWHRKMEKPYRKPYRKCEKPERRVGKAAGGFAKMGGESGRKLSRREQADIGHQPRGHKTVSKLQEKHQSAPVENNQFSEPCESILFTG